MSELYRRSITAACFVLIITGLAACTKKNVPPAELPTKAADNRSRAAMVKYVNDCKEELGIKNYTIPDFNCFEGEEIPIYFSSKDSGPQTRLTKDNWKEFDANGRTCDDPHWLEPGCFTYDFVQSVKVHRFNELGEKEFHPDVYGVFNCRQKYFTDGKNNALNFKQRQTLLKDSLNSSQDPNELKSLFAFTYEMDDIGFVLQNIKTGKTCYFTMFGKNSYGGYIPSPEKQYLSKVDTKTVWEELPTPKPIKKLYPQSYWNKRAWQYYNPPEETWTCVNCHAQGGGFKYSPFIEQMDILPDIERTLEMPYLPVGDYSRAVFKESEIVQIDTEPIDGVENECTSCHRLVSGEDAKFFIEAAVGKTGEYSLDNVSSFAKKFPKRAWMPYYHGLENEKTYLEEYGKHIEAILCCNQNPYAIGCRSRDIGEIHAKGESQWWLGGGPEVCVP